MDTQFKDIRNNFHLELKSADLKYTMACARAGLPPKECIYKAIDSFLRCAIANGFAFDTQKSLDSTEPFDPATMFPKDIFLKICSDAYDKNYPEAIKLVHEVREKLAEAESLVAPKN